MTKYEIIADKLQSQIDSGEITLEFAEEVNTIAYTDYLFETVIDDETISNYFDIMEAVTKSTYSGKSVLTSTQVYIDAIKKSSEAYKSNVGNIKDLIKDKKFKNALDEIEECEGILRELKHLVNSTPESITENEIILLGKVIGKALIVTTLFATIYYVWKTYDEGHKGVIDMKEVKVKPNKGEKNSLADPNKQTKYVKQSPLESAKDESKKYFKDYMNEQKEMLPLTAAIVALTTLASKKTHNSVNDFKKQANKGIDGELKALTKLRKKCIKLKEKSEKRK